jgi:mannosyltransferase OCH1-like enzyme
METNKIKYAIPKKIHYTFKTNILPQNIVDVINHNKKICRDFEFIFYDDNDIDNFIKTNFNSITYNAFKNINDKLGAMKADFFRYCVLYIIGGVYIDVKSKINFPLKKIIHPKDVCILDIPRNSLERWRRYSPTYEQWLLIFAPRHPYLLSMINLMVNYINNKYEPKINGIRMLNTKEKILNITGPDAFTRAINYYLISTKKNKIRFHRCIDYCKYFQLNGVHDYKNMYILNGSKHYSEINEPLYK